MFHRFREPCKSLIASTNPSWPSARTGDVFEFEIIVQDSLKLSCNLLFCSLLLKIKDLFKGGEPWRDN